MRIGETREALEISAPWVRPWQQVALLLVPMVFFGLWLWSEWSRAAAHPAVILIPLPIMSLLAYGVAAVALGSTRVAIRRDAIEWRYAGLPTLPSRRVGRGDIAAIGYWQQTVPTRFGSYTTGVAGLVLQDGTRLALLDALEDLAAAEAMATRIGRWLGNVPVQHTTGWPARRDGQYYRWIAYAGGAMVVLLIATAVLSEYYGI